MNNPNIERAQKLVNELNESNKREALFIDRQTRLKSLVEKHGVDLVAVASGLSVMSIMIYIRSKKPNMGESSIAQAEFIIKQL